MSCYQCGKATLMSEIIDPFGKSSRMRPRLHSIPDPAEDCNHMSNPEITEHLEDIFATRRDWLIKAVTLRSGQILRFNPEDLALKDVLAALVAQEGTRRFVVVPHGSVIFVQRVQSA